MTLFSFFADALKTDLLSWFSAYIKYDPPGRVIGTEIPSYDP